MDMSNISSPPTNQNFHPNAVVVGPAAPNQPNQAAVVNDLNPNDSPPKRKPGRPKGSTKKNIDPSAPPKIKRPVGRPRKDGFPAGSVGSSRSRPPKHARIQPAASFPGNYYRTTAGAPSVWPADGTLTGVGYPQIGIGSISSASGPGAYLPIDPNLELDDWADLARTNPNAFLTTLLTALAAPNPISSAGPSVEEAFRSHLGSLSPNPSQMQPIPSLYSILKTFWLPSSPAYFSLTASASTARTPSEHRFLYWDPQPLVFNGISCPSCSASLINKGRISSGPIKIYDIENPFFIIGCEYVCKSSQCISATNIEGRKFSSTDSSILRSLPIKLKDEFPARLMYGDTDAGSGSNIWNWKALGVSLSLWNMVLGCLRAGLKKEAILQLVYDIQHGIPENGDLKPEIQDPEEIVDDDDDDDDDADTSGKPPPDNQPEQGTSADAYHDAWKANSGAGGSPTRQGEAGPSTASTTAMADAAQTSAHASQPYDFNKATPYAQFPYAAYAFFPTGPNAASQTTPTPGSISAQNTVISGSENALKRPYPFASDDTAGLSDSGSLAQESSKRSPRHCCKCGSQECKGKGGRLFCVNPCQDCGKLDCKGRNSRRPDKKCGEGWL